MTTKIIIIFFLIFKKYSPKEFNKERLPTGKQDIPELQFKHLYGSRPAWPSCRNEDMDLNHQRQPDQPLGSLGADGCRSSKEPRWNNQREMFIWISAGTPCYTAAAGRVWQRQNKSSRSTKRQREAEKTFFQRWEIRLNTSTNVFRLLSNKGFTIFFLFFPWRLKTVFQDGKLKWTLTVADNQLLEAPSSRTGCLVANQLPPGCHGSR